MVLLVLLCSATYKLTKFVMCAGPLPTNSTKLYNREQNCKVFTSYSIQSQTGELVRVWKYSCTNWSLTTYVLEQKCRMCFNVFTEQFRCGRQPVDHTFISGTITDPEKNPVGLWPWIASIGYYDKDDKWQHQCGATLISDRHFLTAAHCTNKRQVNFGEHSIN